MFYSIFTLNLTKTLLKSVFFLYYALILAKALPKRVFLQCLPVPKPYPKGCFSLFLSLFKQKLDQKGRFSPFCLFCYQSPATKGTISLFLPYQKGRFLYFAIILTKNLQKGCFFSLMPLFLSKPYHKWCVFLYIYALILT